jgi:beta-galactosidase
MSSSDILYLGAAYYPEDWDESEQAADIAKMKEAGINVVRMAEFAWHNMEPEEGKFDFSWLHRVMDSLAAAGIRVMLGTPSATPPVWLERKYPDMFMVDEGGVRHTHGARRSCCSNNPEYRRYSRRIAEKMAAEFGSDPNVIGWQIDNEINGSECWCPTCVSKFREYLAEKYGTVGELNRRWDLNLFSQAYDSFDEIPAPQVGWHNPHLMLEWRLFQGRSQISFVHMQAQAMRAYTQKPIGTDLMPINWLDYRDMASELDILEFNHYNTPENLREVSLWFDYMRTLKERPFWNTETSTCWNGAAAITQSIKPEGFCVANSFLPVALGGEANMYWIWRTHWGGHELNHGSVLSASGAKMHIFGEVQKVAEGFEKARGFICSTRVVTDTALHFSSLSWNLSAVQPIVAQPGENTGEWDSLYYKRLQNTFYQPLQDAGVRPDVIDAQAPLGSYRLLVTGAMLTTEEGDLPQRIERWVRGGGVWLAGPMTDLRNSVGAHYTDRETGMLEKLTGVTLRYCIPDTEHRITARWSDGGEFCGSDWYQLYEGADETLASVTGGHSALVGKSVAAVQRVGKGAVILLGTFPCEKDMRRIIEYALKLSGASRLRTRGHVAAVPRRGGGREGLILIETANEAASCEFDGVMTDLLTGREYSGGAQLKPYEVLVLERREKA